MRLKESLRNEDDVMSYNPLKEEIELDEEVLEETVPHIITRKEAVAKLLEFGDLEAIVRAMNGDQAIDVARVLGLF